MVGDGGPEAPLGEAIPAVERAALPLLVVGVDGGDGSAQALTTARRLALLMGARVAVVYVRHRPPVIAPDVPVQWVSGSHDAQEVEVRALSARLLEGVTAEVIVSEGGVASELERIAGEQSAELLIVGRSHGGLLRHLWEGEGSVGEHAVRASPVPVLVAR